MAFDIDDGVVTRMTIRALSPPRRPKPGTRTTITITTRRTVIRVTA